MLLEVIVQTVAEAVDATAGGADRLEIVRDLGRGGLTPPVDLVRDITRATSLPLRVMVREHDTFTVENAREMTTLRQACLAFASLDVDGVVIGFARDGAVDVETTAAALSETPALRATFHRAFDAVSDWPDAIARISQLPQVDRILTSGGGGSWSERSQRLHACVDRAAPRLTIVAGGGIDDDGVRDLVRVGKVREVHVGRAARTRPDVQAPVDPERVRQLKALLAASIL
jgi:copper homeostasis protein